MPPCLLDEERLWARIVMLYREGRLDDYALIELSHLLAEIEEQCNDYS